MLKSVHVKWLSSTSYLSAGAGAPRVFELKVLVFIVEKIVLNVAIAVMYVHFIQCTHTRVIDSIYARV